MSMLLIEQVYLVQVPVSASVAEIVVILTGGILDRYIQPTT